MTPAPSAIVIARGREYTSQEINDRIQVPGAPFGSWDADGHGSHVMGIAAGNGSQAGHCHLSGYYVGVAPGADLIAVKSPLDEDSNITGVTHIFQRAQNLGKAAVVNLSFGSPNGAHDGSTKEERMYDLLLSQHPAGRAIVVSAGNDAGHFDVTAPGREDERGGGLHSLATVGANRTTTLQFVIGPNDSKEDRFYLYYGGAGRLSFQLKEPGGATLTGPVAPGDPAYATPLAGNPLRILNRTSVSTTGRHKIAMRIQPGASGAITQGPWTISLTETAGTTTDFDCWIHHELDDPHPRFSNADQDGTRTLTTPGTAHNVITVANYNHRTNELADHSSRGPTIDLRPEGETKPDIAAPGVGITSVLSGAVPITACCKCCCDFYVPHGGTSMSAPHVAGIIALMFQRNPTLTFTDVRAALRAHADEPDPIIGPTLPNSAWGAGIVNADKAVSSVAAHAAAAESPAARPAVPAPVSSRVRELRRAVAASPVGSWPPPWSAPMRTRSSGWSTTSGGSPSPGTGCTALTCYGMSSTRSREGWYCPIRRPGSRWRRGWPGFSTSSSGRAARGCAPTSPGTGGC